MTDQAANLAMLLSSKGMGDPNPAPAAGPSPAPADPAGPAAPTLAAPAAATGDTASEKAESAAAPSTEDEAADAGPVVYKIGDRELTDAQINGTFDRYSALNQMHADNAPAINLIKQLRERTGMDANQTAALIANALKSAAANKGKQNPVNTGEERAIESRNDTDMEAELKKWEEDNAISLPPGLRNALTSQQKMQGQNAQMMKLIVALAQRMQGGDQQVREQRQRNETDASANYQQRVASNLDAVQKKFGFPDDKIDDFQQFAMARGYTVADFYDATLAMTVGQDFQNAINSGEMERIRGIMSKRQAFTGSLTPGAGGEGAPAAAAPAANVDPMAAKVGQMTDRILARRNMS
jgi:hypothetical protein